MSSRRAITSAHAIIALVIAMVIIVGLFVVLRQDPWGQGKTVQQIDNVDPALIVYEQTAEIPTGLNAVAALAVGPDGRIYVGGQENDNGAIFIFSPDGKKLSAIALDDVPMSLAIGGEDHDFPGRIYVGSTERVKVIDNDGQSISTWQLEEGYHWLVSIAASTHDIFAADLCQRLVWRFDTSGEVRGKIDGRRGNANNPGFVIAGGVDFDLALGDRGLVYVVNPVALRVEAYRGNGKFESQWGHGSPETDGFQGCCNPIHIAILPDGRFVTAEKGIPRIKVFDQEGKFECVVASSAEMPTVAADLATDKDGRILVLDPLKKSVRIFESRHLAADETSAPENAVPPVSDKRILQIGLYINAHEVPKNAS
jgi:DNA-binding beta-propeller fold protein YncE